MNRSEKISRERAYNIIRRPLITEKTTLGSAFGQVSFQVSKDANKVEIKQAVEILFDVEVMSVNTSVLKGKRKRFRGHMGKQKDIKKALVTLKEGHVVDVSSGL